MSFYKQSAFFALMLFVTVAYAVPLDTFPRVDLATAFSTTTSGITITAQYFTASDSENYFGSDLIKQGYRPIFLQISNQTDRVYHLMPDAIDDLLLIKPSEVYELLRFNIWSYASILAFSVWNRVPYAWPAAVAVPLYLFNRYNRRLLANVQHKILDPKHPVLIHPGESVSRIALCLERSFISMFSLVLVDEALTAEVRFLVDLVQPIRSRTHNPLMQYIMVD